MPPIDKRKKNANYGLLDENGIIKTRIDGSSVYVDKGDVIIGKVLTKSSKSGEEELFDCSYVIKAGEEGYVDRVIETITPNGYKMIKVTIRNQKIPEVGDKVASRSAQKGTIGAIYSQEDMPFTQDGITPDIIINPMCIPSRMTISQLLETVLGKSCAIEGTFGDSTPFTESSTDIAEKLCDRLQKNGYERHGWESLYSGFTGEPIQAKVFMGPTYYQRLKHLVKDKIHSRAHGHVTTLTRQPLEGRSRDGGLRFGEINFLVSVVTKLLLVYSIVGNIFKLRENLEIMHIIL
jgi:DNA-directed RNA polymerase II subunit RPB2